MSKTLPAGWAALLDGSFTVAYMIKLDSRDGATVFRWSTVDTTDIASWTGTDFTIGRIRKGGLGKVTTSIDLSNGGGLGRVGDWQFALLNQDGFFNTYFLDQWIEQAVVEVKRFIIEAEPASWDDGLTVFKGIVADYDYDQMEVRIKCIADETEHNSLPRTILNETDFPDVPDAMVGKPVPIQIGTLAKAEMIWNTASETEVVEPHYATDGSDTTLEDDTKSWAVNELVGKDCEIVGGTAKGQFGKIRANIATALSVEGKFETAPTDDSVYRVTENTNRIILSDKPVKELVQSGGKNQFWFFDDSSKLYIPITQSILTFSNDVSPFAGFAGAEFASGSVRKNEVAFFFPFPFTELGHESSDWTNPERMIDSDPATYAELIFSGLLYKTPWAYFRTNLMDEIGEWEDIFVYGVFKATWASPPLTVQLQVTCNKESSGLELGNATEEADDAYYGNSLKSFLISPPSGFPAEANMKLLGFTTKSGLVAGDWMGLNKNRCWRIFIEQAGGSHPLGSNTIQCHEIGLVFTKKMTIDERTRIFTACKGRMYGGTWDSRKTATDLIENPADVVENFLRNDLAVTDIDTDGFDAANTARTGEKLAYTIKDPISSLAEIEKICQETMMAYWKRYDGKHTLRALELDVDGPTAIDDGDVLMNDDNVSTFSARTSPLSAVVNEYYIHYDKDPCLDEYHGLVYLKSPNETTYDPDFSNLTTEGEMYWALANESYQRYGVVKTKHIYLDRISDKTTAENLLKRMVFWRFLRIPEASWQEQLQHCNLEIMDQVSFGTTHREGNFVISEVSEDLDLDRIAFRARFLTDEVAHGIWSKMTEESDAKILEESTDQKVTE